MLVVVALCYVKVKREPLTVSLATEAEFYPLSSFPMFSTFADSARYVYLADASGQPVLPSTYNSSTGSLSKGYRKYLMQQKKRSGRKFEDLELVQRRTAGDQLLRDLRESVAPAAFDDGSRHHLTLHEVVLRRDAEGGLERDETLVGEYVGELAAAGGADAAP